MTNKKRLIIFFSLALIISTIAFITIKLAEGYRPDFAEKTLKPTGLLVATSTPEGAQLWIDHKLKSATDVTLNLPPGKYEVEIKKDGFTSWKKTLQIKKELVTQTDAYLFSTFPDLKALTFTGAADPLLSPDGQKVLFSVSQASLGKNGLWVLDLADRPLGLSREPRQIITSPPTGGAGRDFTQSERQWSPDSKQILAILRDRPASPSGELTTENFLLETDRLNPAVDLIDISENLVQIQNDWEEERQIRQKAQFNKLPDELTEALGQAIDNVRFSPDETKILYTATGSATIPEEIVSPLPAANTQPESRQIEPGKTYVYDLKEDKNFFIMEEPKEVNPIPAPTTRLTTHYPPSTPLSWFPTSKHLFLVQNDKITTIEYDGTNQVDVYSGPFENSFAFPFPSGNRSLILASIGKDTPPNLYAVSLR